jgi:hypothetical protein
METTTLNREGWLTEFARRVAPIMEQRTGLTVPMDKLRLSCSFPRTRATPNKNGSFHSGQCFHGNTHKSGLHEIMINPLVSEMITKDGRGVCETVLHEMLHASLPEGTMHKAAFAKAAKKMGLDGENSKPTSTTLGPEGRKIVAQIIADMGQAYPHEALDGTWGRKQGTRLIKVSCPDCGYINEAGNGYTTRITMSWIEVGLPVCPCGQQLEVTDKNVDTEVIALKPVESSATYRVPTEDGSYDDRFQIRRVSSEHYGERWSVIDFGESYEMIVNGEARTVTRLGSTARIVSAESKSDALALIGFIREGTFTWDQIEADRNAEFEDFEDEDDGENPLAENDPDLDALLYIGDDEDEDPDHPEDQTPEPWVHPRTGKVVHFDYDAVASSREG